MNPNPIAWLALVLVVPFAFFAFYRWRPLDAAMIVMFGSAMFLPANIGFPFPILPDLDKEVVPAAACLVAGLALKRKAFRMPFKGPDALVLAAVVGAIGTMATNQDPVIHGPTALPALTFYDLINDMAAIFLKWFPPFYLGRTLVKNGADLRQMLRFMVLCGLVYSIPILIEIRLSPQLNDWIYGYHQSDFVQTIRFGGYRPKVFMRHGLNVALFMTMTLFAAVALYRAKVRLRRFVTPGRAALYLLLILILCKSTGAYFHIVAIGPVLLFASPRIQRWVAIALVVIVLGYPMIRMADLVPVQEITDWMAVNVNEERALSLWFRMFTEGQILENTRDRILFGWGGYARFFEYDEVTGASLTIIDGYWTNELGHHGLWGFFCIFGLVLSPTLLAIRALPKIANEQEQLLVASGALMVALYVSDWIPNASWSADLTFMAGGVAGGVIGIVEEQRRAKLEARRERAEAGRARRAARDPGSTTVSVS